jgi:TonB-linked SusC/RagA family outer membrane protein
MKQKMKTYFSVRMLTKTIFSLVFVMLINHAGWAQEKSLSGVVVDAEGKQTLPGATIAVKGTSKGVVADLDGKFEIKGSKGDVLLVSYVGYKTKEITIGDQTQLSIGLSSTNNLNEVVVVGYGTQKKQNLSGSVATVDMKKLESRPTANISQSLQGTVANLNITFASGAPGGSAKINIRGYTSINGGSPLILIDGVPSSEGDLTRMNPDDVKSISVLKDASSAAIYGARAAFGVLLITTKTGGKNKITYSNSFIWSKPTITPKPITDPYIFSRLLDTATNNTPWDYVNFSDETYAWARDRSNDPSLPSVRLDPQNPDKWQYMGNTNWNKFFFNDVAFSENHNVSISGQKENFNYYLSGNHTLENGLNKLATDSWTRNALRSKMQLTPYEWMKLENNTFLTFADRENPTYNLTRVYNLKPTDVAKNPDGTWANTDAGRAAASMIDGGNSRSNTTNLQTTNKIDLTFFDKALKLTGEHTYQKNYLRSHSDGTKYKIGYGPKDIREVTDSDFAYESLAENKYSVLNLYATYTKSFNQHSFNVVMGYNKEVNKFENFSANRDKLISSSLPNLGLATGEQTVGWGYSDWAVTGVFGRLNYIFNEKYIIEFNGRRDGSSRFPSGKRYGFFPSVSAAWIASKEEFLQPYIGFMSNLKFRVSSGSLGNQSVGDYGYINSMSTGQSGYLINGEYPKTVYSPGLNVDQNNYTWEKVNNTNFGVDLGFFKGALNASFDYYIRKTMGMLIPGQELPGVLGTTVPKSNSADLQNKGWDLSIAYNGSADLGGSPLGFGASLVLSDSQTTITKYKNDDLLFSGYREGAKIGEIWGLENDGFFANAEEIKKLDESAIIPWGALSIVPGWPKYVDQNGDGKITKGQSSKDPKDLKLIGNSEARYQFGVNMNVNYKGFDLSTFLQGVGKRDYYPSNYLFWGPYQQPYANMYPHLLDFYRGAADSDALRAQHSQSYINAGLADANLNPQYPVLQSWLADANYGAGLAIPQTKYLLNAAYLRVKNITLGYTIPSELVRKVRISQLRFYVTGENIYEWSAIKKFIDPEATGDSGYAYPFNRKLSVGMNATF